MEIKKKVGSGARVLSKYMCDYW